MVTEGNGGLGSIEEVREGQLMDPALERLEEYFRDDSIQNTLPWSESYTNTLACEENELVAKPSPGLVGERFGGSLQSNRVATEGNGVLGSSEEVREGQLMDPALERVADGRMEDSTRNTLPWLESYTHTLVHEAFGHFVKSGPASVAAFLMEDSTQNTLPWLQSYIHTLVREAFGHFVKSGPVMLGGREQIQEPDRSVMQLRFQTSMPAHFFVGKKVEGQAGAICVNLIDTTTGRLVASGALSSLTLDAVVLAGDFNNEDDDDWTWEHFKSKVEPSREGKGPLLEGGLQVPLKGGVGLLEDIKFTDISTCRPSGKFRLGVKVETGFFKGIRVREAKTDAFEVKHYKKESEEKNVPRALDDDVCTLKSIGKNGPSHNNLKDAEIFKVKHFLWKLLLDPEGLRKILGKTMSNKNWKTLRDHAKESVPSGKYHVYYADKTKNSGVVFKNMSELCGLIEDGGYHSTETLSDSQKESENTLKTRAGDNWKDIVEYFDPLPSEMNPSKRPRSSQTDAVTWDPESFLFDIDPASLSCVLSPVNPWPDIGVPSGEASGNPMPGFEDCIPRSLLDEDSIDSTSLFQPDLSEKADGNTIANRSGFPSLPCPAPSKKADGNTALSFGTHGGSFKREEQPGGSKSGKKDQKKEEPRGSKSGKKDQKKEEPRGSKSEKKEEKKAEKIIYRRPACPPMPPYINDEREWVEPNCCCCYWARMSSWRAEDLERREENLERRKESFERWLLIYFILLLFISSYYF